MDLFYREYGNGPVLVILHGLFGSSDNWMSIAKVLGSDYRIILPDLRNHGNSPHSSDWNYELMAQDLKGLCSDLGLSKFFLLGHSMGGKVAMQYATQFPEEIEKLVIADIGPKAYPPHHQSILEGLNGLDLQAVQSRKEADESLSTYIPELGVRAFLLKNLGRDQEGKFYWKINLPIITQKISEVGEVQEDGKGFSGPTLFIRGEKSKYILDEDWRTIQEKYPDSKLETIGGAGHWLHAEKPKEFVESLKSFLEN